MTTSAQPTYPACCPSCQEANGWPYSAGTCDRPGVIVVKLRCKVCQHEWTDDAPKAAAAIVAAWPAHERRRFYRTA
jgi:hypothetical protein